METLKLPEWFKEARDEPCPADSRQKSPGFLEKNLANIASVMLGLLASEETASKKGLMQSLEPRVRIFGILAIVVASALTVSAWVLAFAGLAMVFLAYTSGAGFAALAKRVAPSFVFTTMLVVPVFFSPMTPGEDLVRIAPRLSITVEGASIALFFILRVTVMVSLIALLFLTTRQSDFFKGLGGLKAPRFFATALFMTFRYIFILLKTAEDSTLARKSRTISPVRLKEAQDWFASRITLILKKSLNMSEEVNMAMTSRGFAGSIRSFDGSPLGIRDYAWLAFSLFTLFVSFGI